MNNIYTVILIIVTIGTTIYNIEGVIQIAARDLVRVVASCSFG